MRIVDLFRRGSDEEPDRPVISFEFFPPKSNAGFRGLFRTIEELRELRPSYVSVTMGAGGSTRSKTVDLVARIQREAGLTAMAHLPCVGFERSQVTAILDRLAADEVQNVLALGGDPPKDAEDFVQPEDGFTYANELTEFIRSHGGFSIGGACYPEVHPRAASPEEDLRNLVRKVRAGSDFLITQLFFDNRCYFDFVERAREAGIEVPIVAGIMPITSVKGIRRMLELGGGRMPPELEARIDAVADDDEASEVGVEWATEQCRELIERGVPGIHFYTLNRSPSTRRIFENLFG